MYNNLVQSDFFTWHVKWKEPLSLTALNLKKTVYDWITASSENDFWFHVSVNVNCYAVDRKTSVTTDQLARAASIIYYVVKYVWFKTLLNIVTAILLECE